MSKMESGNFEISPEPFAPRAALLHCCNLLALKARENGVDLVTRAPEDLPVMTGDPRAFKQIVLNLVANAIKFTERGGNVTVSAAVEGSRLMLRVTDTGVGIARRRSQADRRSVLPGRQDLSAQARRHRPRAVDREGPGRIAPWRDERAEQGRRGHHGDRGLAACLHAVGGGIEFAFEPGPASTFEQCRDAEAGAAIRITRPSPSGEEKCLSE